MPSSSKLSTSHSARRSARHEHDVAGDFLIREMLTTGLISVEDWELLPVSTADELARCPDTAQVLCRLIEHRLLTEYQAARVRAGKTFGLILGNYRVLDRLGAGGMGIVFKAEHLRMRRLVAIKVLPLSPENDSRILLRFFTEMRAAAQLHHPNIVTAIDAGETTPEDPDSPVLHYFVMEYVAGQDLEEYVKEFGPIPVAKACDLAYQVASALGEAHKHNLVHRDIKPSNVLMTPEGQAKLLDFGLARHFRNRMTEPGTVLGTIDFMPPEQARDSSAVDIRADIYGLGGTLFWCLAGRLPFQPQGDIAQDLAYRLSQPPPSVRTWRSEVPAELDAIISRTMALNPDDRYATPQVVMRALLPFIKPESRERVVLRRTSDSKLGLIAAVAPATKLHQVLIVDDENDIRTLCRFAIQADGVMCDEASNGVRALEACTAKRFDLVLLDIDMPEMNGLDVLQYLRKSPPAPHLKIIMFSGRASADEMAEMMLAGADDYLTKPFSVVQLVARVKAALRLKDAQDRSDLLNRHLLTVNSELERNLTARDSDLVHARNALVLALAKLVEHRDTETGAHLMRLQRYCRILGEETAGVPTFTDEIDAHFIQMLECCAPLHDIGKVGLPDHILLKPGKLDPDERIIMQSHTIIGADTLQQVAKQHNFAMAFLQMAIDIARHHHERYDGTGYPDRLGGTDIPLSARLVTLSDVYDALRSRRVYKPALSHAATVQIMCEGSKGQFDPALLEVFLRCSSQLERIFRELTD
ncbi:MAG TPA: response regulator [Gemmataceae bacterium]|nr:response regulator [Gemmataceae bacterium]